MHHMKMVFLMNMLHLFFQYTAVYYRLLIAGICTCHVQCYRIEGCKHSYIRDNRNIIFWMAVAVR